MTRRTTPALTLLSRVCLSDCGFLHVRRDGRFAYYHVADPRVGELVRLARSLASDNAAALAACVRIAPPPSTEHRVPGRPGGSA